MNVYSLFSLTISLGFFIAGTFGEEKGEKKPANELHRVVGHLDCTSYYKPCAIDCYHVYETVEQNLQGLQTAINSANLPRLESLFGPNIVAAPFFNSSEPNIQGTCALIEAFADWFPVNNGQYVEIQYNLPVIQNDNVATIYYTIRYYASNNNLIGTVSFSATFVKNACDSWVQDLIIITEFNFE